MLLVLGIDASTDMMGVALHGDEGLLAESALRLPMKHSAYLMPLVRSVMQATKTDRPTRIGVTVGPGSFTGLRIGISTAKALAYAWDIPVVAVSTLEALVHGVRFFNGTICSLMDARKGRVYAAIYQGGQDRCTEVIPPWAGLAGDLWEKIPKEGPLLFVGGYPHFHREEIEALFGARAVIGGDILPRVAYVAELGSLGIPISAFALEPEYLRRSGAEINWERKKRESRLGGIPGRR